MLFNNRLENSLKSTRKYIFPGIPEDFKNKLVVNGQIQEVNILDKENTQRQLGALISWSGIGKWKLDKYT